MMNFFSFFFIFQNPIFATANERAGRDETAQSFYVWLNFSTKIGNISYFVEKKSSSSYIEKQTKNQQKQKYF